MSGDRYVLFSWGFITEMGKLRTILLSLCLLYFISQSTGHEPKQCIQKIENCSEDEGPCEKSFSCFHGNCDDSGTCKCKDCWEGEECNRYVDNYPPVFPDPQQRVVISDLWDADAIYVAKAYDADLGSTCPLESFFCECTDVNYDIIDGNNEGFFMINNITGEVFVLDPLHIAPGKTYNILIEAQGGQIWNEKGHSGSTMELKIKVEDPHSHIVGIPDENEVSWIGMDSHYRGKRSLKQMPGDSPNYLTEFNFTILSGEVETMETGKRIDFRLEISIPKTDSIDLTVELFTKDIANGNYTPVLALFNVEVDAAQSGLTFQQDKPHIEMLLNDEINTAYDRAIITCGDIKNPNANAASLVMYFSVTQIRNPGTVFDAKYLVTAGAEYDKETYVWVGQSEVTVHNSTDEPQIELKILGPDEIPLDSAGVYVMKSHIAVKSDNFTVEVNILPEAQEYITVGNLGVKDFDKNYDPVPQNIYFYNTTMEGSDDDVLYQSAQLYLGIMTNVGSYQGPMDDGNVINVTFAIYALNNETNIDKSVTFEASIVVGRERRFSETKTVKLVPRVVSDKKIEANNPKGEPATTAVQVGDMATYTLWFNLTNNGYADFLMEVEVQRDNKKLPRLEACSARMWKYQGSFDVPYVNTTFIDPEIVDDKYVFKFNRLHVTEQRTPAIYNDSMIYIHLVVKVSALPTNNKDKRLTPTIRVGTQGATGPLGNPIQVDSLIIKDKQKPKEPIMLVENAVDWPFLYVGGAIVLNITMEVPPSTGYAEVMLETSGENNPPLPAVHICRAELSDVGRNVPCLRMHQDEVNADFTKYSMTDPKTRTKPDVANVILGDVGALPVAGKNHATVSVVVELPEKSSIKDNEQYPISSGLILTKDTIWAAVANYTMKKGPPPQIPPEKFPECRVVYNDTGVVPGHLAEVLMFVRTKIQSISTYIMEVEGSTKDVSLCGLKVKSFGRNTPCIDMETEPFYHPHDNPLDGNKIAGLKFSALSNIGFRENEEHDTISAIALVRISPSCKVKKTEMKWRVKYGDQLQEGKIDISVILGSESSDMFLMAKEPQALSFKSAYPGKMISLGTPVVVDLEVSLVPGSLAPVIVSMKNADTNKRRFPYDMCLGGIWFRGRNYPCFSPVQVESNFSSSESDSGRNDSAAFNLGLVCNTFVDSKEEENKVTVRMALRPVDDGTLKIKDTFNIEGHSIVGSHHKLISTLPFTIAREADQVEAETNASLKLVEPTPIPIRVHQRLWIPFNITIPPDSLVKVDTEAKAPLKNNRAVLTVHNIRLVSGGVNIPCPMLYPQPKVTFNPIVKTTQSDVVTAYIGYFTNLGLSHKMNLAVEGDDHLTIEVEVEMSDHPETFHDSIFYLAFSAQVGRSILTIEQPLKVFRDGAERADLDVKIKVDNTKVYQSGDSVDVTITVKHTNISTAEPINATVRLYLPPYIEFNKVLTQEATIVGNISYHTEEGGLDIVFPQFLFSDSAVIVVSLLADPKNQRGFGRGEVNATTPYRVLCKQNFREEPSLNPETADTIVNCGPVDYITYLVNSQECYKVLGIKDPKKIYKCQFSASSAAKRETGPYNARQGGKRGWSPALRLGPYKPYLQIDFLRATRVSKLEFIKVEETRPVTKYRLQYSHTGSDWLYANSVTELVYKGEKAFDTLEKPVQTRFVRVIIEEAEKGLEDQKYIGVKMEMYGCHIAEKTASATCARRDPTWYSDDKNKYSRHFSIDVARDIAYFCDLDYGMENLLCFSSTDAGNSWRTLPQSFGGILGYDKKLSRTYAIDKRRRAYVASDDGVLWIAVDEAEVNNTMTKKSFGSRQPVPAFTSEDITILETKTGRWEATFDGLMYEGKLDPKARWSRCCRLTK